MSWDAEELHEAYAALVQVRDAFDCDTLDDAVQLVLTCKDFPAVDGVLEGSAAGDSDLRFVRGLVRGQQRRLGLQLVRRGQ
jgi:hypothetical protein